MKIERVERPLERGGGWEVLDNGLSRETNLILDRARRSCLRSQLSF